jgi:hypothetical protein
VVAVGDSGHLGHQRFINTEAAGGIEHHHVKALQLRGLAGALGNPHRRLAGNDRQGGDAGLFTQHAQLFLGGRTSDVQAGHHDLLAFTGRKPACQLGAARRLAGALQANHHDNGGRRNGNLQRDWFFFAAEQFHQAIVDDLDDLLARRDRFDDFGADGTLGGVLDEILDDRQSDIGFQQRHAHFAHGGTYVDLGQRATTAQPLENAAQPLGKTVKQSPEALLKNRPASK